MIPGRAIRFLDATIVPIPPDIQYIQFFIRKDRDTCEDKPENEVTSQ